MKTEKKHLDTIKNAKLDVDIFNLINSCWENAIELSKESRLLIDNKCYARSFALSYFALEELGKRLACCDYDNEILSREEFDKIWNDHLFKIAYLHNNCKLEKTVNQIGYRATIVYDKKKFTDWFKARNLSLYVDINGKKIMNPQQEITENDANEIYFHLEKLIQDTIYYETVNERFGSKAFYK